MYRTQCDAALQEDQSEVSRPSFSISLSSI